MSREEIEKFEHAYHYWINDKIDDGDFSTLVYNFINNTKPLIDEIAELKSQLLISEQKVKLNYNCAIESSKSEANEAVIMELINTVIMHTMEDTENRLIKEIQVKFTITRNNK